jgi:4-aminobutyrate aminotransferase
MMYPETDAWLGRDAEVLAPTLARVTDIVAAHAEGSWITDVDGRRFLDLSSGIGATSTGHCHPHVVAAIAEQATKLLHTSVVTHHERSVELGERLAALVPFFASPQCFFSNSGAEVVDGSLKLARRVTGRAGVIGFAGAFHGRTLGATSLTTSKAKYRAGYEPFLPGVHTAPYARHDREVAAALAAVDELFATAAIPIGAVLVEPVLGEGGYVVPPVDWLQGLRDRCDEHGALLIFDEVQCGMGRTGRPFAAETFGVRPDVLLVAKGIASGLPLAAIVAERDTFALWPPGAHGSTFGGNPVSCAAAVATIDVLEREQLCARTARLGGAGLTRLQHAVAGNPAVADVRGVGLMIGIELVDGDAARALQHFCLDQHTIVLTCGADDEVVRLVPALTIAEHDWERGLDVLIAGLNELGRTAHVA